MKKSGFFFIFLLYAFCSWSQAATNKSKLTEYPFGQYLSDKLDRSQFKTVGCKWNVFFVFFKVNAKSDVSDIRFSDSTPAIFQNEVRKVLDKNEYKWPTGFLKYKDNKRVIVQPVFVQLVNDCQLPRIETVKYRGIDSTLEKELSNSYYVSKVVTQNLVSVSESFRRIQMVGGKQVDFLDCIVLPTCFIEDIRKPEIKM